MGILYGTQKAFQRYAAAGEFPSGYFYSGRPTSGANTNTSTPRPAHKLIR
ncbi:hypothetical protein V1279_001301 [Bradyrhizobium sp. AZCC 1610]